MSTPSIQLLLTGDELMSGDIDDTNSSMIGHLLTPLGLTIDKKVTVGDNLKTLVEEIKIMSKNADVVIVNGGLGPTIDDKTAQALALAKGVPIEKNPTALAHVTQWCKTKGIDINEPNIKQALIPQTCTVIPNKTGSAVGIKLNINNCWFYCTPGVPNELGHMMIDEILPELKKQTGRNTLEQTHSIQVYGIGESNLQLLINRNFTDWPAELTLGFRAAYPYVDVKLTTSNSALLEHWLEKVCKLLGDHVISINQPNSRSIAAVVLALLRKEKKTITFAESCTGGLIASQLTQISGSSAVFEAGFVTYSNRIKQQLINVSSKTLEQYGAVSKQTVIEMAQGALSSSSADFVIAVSGIAGPTGEMPGKPIGSVWIACGSKNSLTSHYFCLPNTRINFQKSVAARAFDLIRRKLIKSTELPYYLK